MRTQKTTTIKDIIINGYFAIMVAFLIYEVLTTMNPQFIFILAVPLGLVMNELIQNIIKAVRA